MSKAKTLKWAPRVSVPTEFPVEVRRVPKKDCQSKLDPNAASKLRVMRGDFEFKKSYR